MPSFDVSHKSRLCPEQAFERVSSLIENEQRFRDIDPQYQCTFDEDSLSGTAKSRMFKARLQVYEEGLGSLVEITIDLPMKYALAKGMISKGLLQKMRSEL
ncbi:MAG: hypothetical protein AB8B86_21210 [Pseudomonadales bacterium]